MKTIRKVIAIILIILTILTSPLAGYFNIENNVYASAAAFSDTLQSELFKQFLIPTLISAGLVFKNKEAIDEVVYDTIDWLYDQGFDWKPPEDPEGPNLYEMIKKMLKGTVLFSAGHKLYKNSIKIYDSFWELVSLFVRENYNVGENDLVLIYKSLDPDLYYLDTSNVVYNDDLLAHEFLSVPVPENALYLGLYYFNKYGDGKFYDSRITLSDSNGFITFYSKKRAGWPNIDVKRYEEIHVSVNGGNTLHSFLLNLYNNNVLFGQKAYGFYYFHTDNKVFTEEEILSRIEIVSSKVIGAPDIVDNPDYDWNNQYTGDKVIVIPIKTDIYGDLAKDDNGYYLPAIETEEWVDVQPEEIPQLDPSGIPQMLPEDLPNVSDDPDEDDNDGKILVFLKNIFNKITGIRNDTATIVEKMPDTSTGGTGGIDTSIPTGFEWGDFRRFFDVIFIFIYFIVILILILLKFLEIVFFNLVAIPANAELFNQYPSILAGLNYIKNLQVGGLSITVHQAFEYVFLIFFFIFIIKQIRKLYGAFVLEENERERDARRDMKMDYYDKNNNVR